MELFFRNWYDKFLQEVRITRELKVISPFAKEQVIRKIQEEFNFQQFELITRFNLRDFASGVSSLPALKFSVESGARI